MRGKYDLPVERGDERTTWKKIEITRNPLGLPLVRVWEEIVSLRANGEEKTIEELPFFDIKITEEELAEFFPRRNPQDDSLTGSETNGYSAYSDFYAWVRKNQIKRDESEKVKNIQTEEGIDNG
jgi:hypothetical protein